MLTFSVGLAIAQAPKAPSVSGAATLQRAYNLTTFQWYASADIKPDAPAEQIEKDATPTSPIVTLKTAPGGSGTLFAIIDLPDAPGFHAQLTIGSIDGDDETFLNGTRIGGHSGFGVTDNGISRLYPISAQLFHSGKNVLAIRMSGHGGGGNFGIKREPLTLGFVRGLPLANAYEDPKPSGGVTAIPVALARKAIEEAEGSTSETNPLYRKKPSFGRFGKYFHDGLPCVSEVSPTHVSSPDAPQIEVALDAVKSVSIANNPPEPGIDGWHKLSRVEATCSGQPIRYTALEQVFYPGCIFTLEEGPVFQLRVKYRQGSGLLQELSEKEAALVFKGQPPGPAFLIYEPRAQVIPVIVAVASGAANITRSGEMVDITLTRVGASREPLRVYVFYPAGLHKFDFTSRPGTFLAAAGVVEPCCPESTLQRWFRLGLYEPFTADEYFRIYPDKNIVRIYQLAAFREPPAPLLNAPAPMLMPPPQVIFARDVLHYPVAIAQTTETGLLSYSGEMHEIADAKETRRHGSIYVTHYDLPIPPMGERGLIAIPTYDEYKQVINQWVSDLGTTTSATAVDALYKSRTQAFQAFSYLSPQVRKRLLDNCAQVVRSGIRDSLWHEEKEPFSGLSFWWTYFIEGPYNDRYDQDWGNGLSLIGLYTYSKYTGDWEFPAKNWDAVERMFSWSTVADDWEWMRASNGVHGHGTGAGDCTSALYAGALGYARLAKGVNRPPEDAHYGLYSAARAAVFTLNRFVYNDFAQKSGFKESNSIVLGFHEGAGFLVGELDGYPWNATSNISGDGVQPENFTLYEKYATQPLREYERTFENAYPQWMEGNYEYPKPTLYHNNSGYITLPHIYLRVRLGMDGFDALISALRKARPNDYQWWLAPPVIAEVLGQKVDSFVSDWGHCGFLGANISAAGREGRHRKIDMEFENKNPPDTVEVALPHRPLQIQINGGPVPLTDSTFENQRLRIRLRHPGSNKVSITY